MTSALDINRDAAITHIGNCIYWVELLQVKKQESLALASMAGDDSPASSTASSTAPASSTAAATARRPLMRGKVGSEFET